MKSILRDYPLGALALVLLACVKFEYHSANWMVGSPGLAGGFAVLVVVAVVLVFKIIKAFNAAPDACIARGLLQSRIRCKYDLLIPPTIFAAMIQGRWFGGPMQSGAEKSGYHWELILGNSNWTIPFLAGLVALVLLLRVLGLFRAMSQMESFPGEVLTNKG